MAKKDAQELVSASEKAGKVEAFWAELETYIQSGWALHITDLAQREAGLIQKLEAENPASAAAIRETVGLAKRHAETVLRRYPSLLSDACIAASLNLDMTSRHPKYTMESGFLSLDIQEPRGVARLSDHEGRLAEIPADVPAVVELLAREHRRLFGRPFNGPKILRTLRGQYKAVVKKDGLSDGDSVPIRHLTRRLGKNVKGFRTDEFLVDLSRLATEGPFEIEGRRLEVQHTKDTDQGMLLIGGGYVGFIMFREAQS